ncbi:hypothetical protein [Streptococcus oricebi]|uniref:Uncharacterized protein n=1 Tax=Streptococcus oricebi TaxID=1547447 RepID=A0ABS5B3P5_9STRE|nr:hypothetical protein [Streptococcus oricebi]MBP2623455.1 hypothetical protein [Streptococcus oricebi]
MPKKSLKEIEAAQLENEREFDRLARKKRQLASFEQDLMLAYSDLYQPLQQLDYQVTGSKDTSDLNELLLTWRRVESQLTQAFIEAEGQLKKMEGNLEDQSEQIARQKRAFYEEEENGN